MKEQNKVDERSEIGQMAREKERERGSNFGKVLERRTDKRMKE